MKPGVAYLDLDPAVFSSSPCTKSGSGQNWPVDASFQVSKPTHATGNGGRWWPAKRTLLPRGIWILVSSSLFAVSCDFSPGSVGPVVPQVEPPRQIPKTISALSGSWQWQVNATVNRESVEYLLDITEGTLVVGGFTETFSPYGYTIGAALKGAKLRCMEGSILLWDVPVVTDYLHMFASQDYRAVTHITLSFATATPFGTMGFNCVATGIYFDRFNQPDYWDGDADVAIDTSTTTVNTQGKGTFDAIRK